MLFYNDKGLEVDVLKMGPGDIIPRSLKYDPGSNITYFLGSDGGMYGKNLDDPDLTYSDLEQLDQHFHRLHYLLGETYTTLFRKIPPKVLLGMG